MTGPRASTFYEALQVSSGRIANLSETELGELMTALFHAEAYRSGSDATQLRVNAEEKARDGGCDGWTAKPSTVGGWLGDADTCWQFKAGTAGEPKRLAGEVLKPGPARTLKSGGRFVVVAAASTRGKPGEDDRLDVLRREAVVAGLPTDRIDVLGCERLTTWCNQHPAVAARWAGRPPGLLTLSQWSHDLVHQVPWQAQGDTSAEIIRRHADLDFENGSIEHLHVVGPPGVGKTRFALELCRDAPWAVSTIYLEQAADAQLMELIHGVCAEPNTRVVVVADEVQAEQLIHLRNAIARAGGRIRLVTVGHCVSPDSARIPAIAVKPLDRELIGRIVSEWHPSMPTEHVDFVARFADGYVRLAKLAADAVLRDTTTDLRKLLEQSDIRAFLDPMLGPGDRRHLHVVAALSVVGWTRDLDIEGKAIAGHLGLDWNDVRDRVETSHRQLGIAPQGGRYRYISPVSLGAYLAVEAWTRFPDLLASLPGVLPTESARDAYYERLRTIASNPHAKEYGREELTRSFQLADLVDPRAMRRWSALSSADMALATQNVLRALEGTSLEERRGIQGAARRELISGLRRLAWRRAVFPDAARALAFLAEAENETWSNNATGEFVGLFQPILGGTAAPYGERLLVLDGLISERRFALTRLVVQALACAGSMRGARMGLDPASDDVPEQEWHPTSGELTESVQSALARLTDIASSGDAEIESEVLRAAEDLVMLLRERPLCKNAENFFDAIRKAYPTARERLRRTIADVLESEKEVWKELSADELNDLEAFHSRFEDASLLARLQQHVGPARWRRDNPDLVPLARDVLASREIDQDLLHWLTSGAAGDGWRFGEALASTDDDGTFLALAETLESDARDLRVVCGYVAALRATRGTEWYDGWLRSQFERNPRPVALLFEVVWRCGATPSAIGFLVELLASQQVPPADVGRLAYGAWTETVEISDLTRLLRILIEKGHGETALVILDLRTKKCPSEVPDWGGMALDLIVTPALIRSEQMTNYHWKELAMRYVDEAAEQIALAITREQGREDAVPWFADHSGAKEVLFACATRNPGAVWRGIQEQLHSQANAYRFSVGFPCGILEMVPLEMVFEWIDSDPHERSVRVARLAPKNFSSDETLASQIIARYGDSDVVTSLFFSRYLSGAWSGPESAHRSGQAKLLDEVARRTALPRLRRWAVEAAEKLRRIADQERQREEERELRGYH